MSIVYIEAQGSTVSLKENRCVIHQPDGLVREIPLETLESIIILGNVDVTTPFLKVCLQKGITLAYFSKGGRYFGRLTSTNHIHVGRQRRQCELYNTPFSLQFSQQIVRAKIKNQWILLSRYAKSRKVDVEAILRQMKALREKVNGASSYETLMGFEGQAARIYFSGLSQVIDSEFSFKGRSRRPPRDPFNATISLGYSILMHEIYGKIESRGLNPYFGFLHRDSEKHPTLASDLMEEWRAVIVDATAMSLINGHELRKEQFEISDDGVFLDKDALRIFLKKLEKKMMTEMRYIVQVSHPMSFRQALSYQVQQLVHAIENGDATLYHPIEIR